MGGEDRADGGGAGEVGEFQPRHFLYSRFFAFIRGLLFPAREWRRLLNGEGSARLGS